MNRFFPLFSVLLLVLAACTENGNIADDPAVTPFIQNPEDGPVDIDDFIVRSASIDFYQARLQSCAEPDDSQFLALNHTFTSKTLVCIRFTVEARANRNATMTTNFETALGEFDFTSETQIAEFNGSTITTVTRQLHLTPENMGELPSALSASIAVINAFDDPIPLVTETLTAMGTVASNDPFFPDGTELVVIRIPPADENSPVPNPGILTRFRDLPLDGNFRVDHDIFVEFDNQTILFNQVIHLASGILQPDEFGQLRAVVEIPRPTELSTYLARVFPLDVNGGCAINDTPIGPIIIYQVEP